MGDFRILQRYAVSLLESALEKNNLDVVTSDIRTIVGSMENSRELQLMLDSPIIRPELKLSILQEIFETKISKDTMDFIKFVVDKRRVNSIKSIGKRFLELRDEHLGIANVLVTTVTDFSQVQKDELKNKMEKILDKKVQLSFRTDAELVGGFIAKVDDTLYDASIRHQLELLKKQFLTGEISLN